MTRDEFLARLQSVEWDDIEFKEATWAVPKSALETVSAFANTEGGHLVFGVKESNGTFSVTGVTEIDKVQNDFFGQVRDSQKISALLPITGDIHTMPEGSVICLYVPEAPRHEKPVHLDRNPKRAYVRKGSGDRACTAEELLRFIRDAGTITYDSETLDLDPTKCFDEGTVRWYRARFEASNPGENGAADDISFLRKWGFLVEREGKIRPTRASIVVLGSGEYVRQELPRLVVDLQLYRHGASEYAPSVRWADRVTIESNLIEAWKAILDFYLKHSEKPFAVDPTTLRRHDDPPDYISFREAAINLLIHQDFGDATRVPVIRFFRDQAEFFNPGDALASREQLLDPGDKEVRNPRIVGAFRRIGLSDQGGTGVGAIFDGWRQLGFVPPEIENDKAEKSFRLRLRREKLVSEEQLLAQASLGVQLSEHEAAVFAYLIRNGEIDLADIKALTGLPGPAVRELAQRLAVQVILRPSVGIQGKFALADHLRTRFLGPAEDINAQRQLVTKTDTDNGATVQVTEQVATKDTEQVSVMKELTDIQWVIVQHADASRTLAELMAYTGYNQRAHFKMAHVEPLLDGGILRMTVPDKPTSSKQRYVLTNAGLKLKTLRLDYETATARKETGE
ncbi:putative DNA binding domain-containing protein [Rhizobium sp. 25PS6]|uniref:RNA-binding domain-containing protein n=1 Tax=Rhizobium sp. 25PS6 TaxID=3075622 RepID=UPI0028FDB20E|nr:RNA-binding domain-containing protein [Rhizobium sp. 25PS6]MDU0365109.1 putative DNA binding domain-containing protein [Rhizobium sp. 25PS6]